MTMTVTATAAPAADDFDISCADAQDEMTCAIKHPKTDKPTTWVWTFYGPAHPVTVDLAAKASKKIIEENRLHKQQQLNGKKIKIETQSFDELREENVDGIVTRTKTFTPIRMNGELIEFSPENARKLLLDRRKSWLFSQVFEFVRADENFIPPSATS
jgi:hypothetical protein